MNRETRVWTMLFVLGGLGLLGKALLTKDGLGRAFVSVEVQEVKADPTAAASSPESQPLTIARNTDARPRDAGARVSLMRTLGLWMAAFFTLCIFSYLYRDNAFYKLAESVIVGVSAGVAMVAAFWEVVVAKLWVQLGPFAARLSPEFVRERVFSPEIIRGEGDLWGLVPLLLGCLLFCRWFPRVAWLARWPLAFVIGTNAGLKLVLILDADFVNQIRSTILPLIVFTVDQQGERVFSPWQSLQNIGLILGVLASLTYFYFSAAHTGLVGKVSRIGIWVLMITFGSSFAFTVMGRITLLTMRLQFLFDDWLWLIDPTGRRG